MADMLHEMALSMPIYGVTKPLRASLFASASVSATESMDVYDHAVDIENVQIQHYDLAWYRGLYIVPTAKGKYQIRCSIMCSEYIEPEIRAIEIEVV